MMETLFTILPFLAIILISLNAYYRYKNRGKEEEPIWTDKYSFTRDIMTAFKRAKYRPWTFLFFFIFWIFLIAFGATINIYLSTPAVPVNKMNIDEGVVKDIIFNKKTSDKLILNSFDGKEKMYALEADLKMKQFLLSKRIKIWHSSRYRIFVHEDCIYQIYIGGKPINEHWNYNYETHIKNKKKQMTLIIKFGIVAFLSAFIMWYANRKELPIHKLNKIKMDAKEKERKK